MLLLCEVGIGKISILFSRREVTFDGVVEIVTVKKFSVSVI